MDDRVVKVDSIIAGRIAQVCTPGRAFNSDHKSLHSIIGATLYQNPETFL